MAHTLLKGTVSFGLVSIPIKLSTAARDEHVSFNLLHDECKSRINQKTYCPVCDKEISRSDTVKGYEVEPDKYVTVTKEELDEVEPASSKVIEITSTCDLKEIDPVLFDASFYLEPEPAGRRGYKLLLTALEKEKKAAVAKLTMHGREHIVIIRAFGTALVAHTMFFADEVAESPVGALDDVKLKPAEIELARKLVSNAEEPFNHSAYKDEYREAVLQLIESKKNLKPRAVAKKKAAVAATGDIMDVMAKSIEMLKKKKTA